MPARKLEKDFTIVGLAMQSMSLSDNEQHVQCLNRIGSYSSTVDDRLMSHVISHGAVSELFRSYFGAALDCVLSALKLFLVGSTIS